ncbi:bactofilin family protein [Mangrovivirga cuniculi]|nr:hypothetical protein [Mangrovivirga cuniculi]
MAAEDRQSAGAGSIVSSGTSLKGNVESNDLLRVEGKIEGDILKAPE